MTSTTSANDTRFEEISSADAFDDAYSIVRTLYEELSRGEYRRRLPAMRDDGYRMFALYKGDEMVAIAGLNVVTNFSNGRHLYLYDLVTHPEHRSRGFGKQILTFVHEWAMENDCNRVKLITGRRRTRAHSFYSDKMGYRKTGYVFKYDL